MDVKTYVVPKKIGKSKGNELVIEWSDGVVHFFKPYDLRLKCPCAKCIDEWTGEPLLDPKSISEKVLPSQIYSVGRYALKPVWNDGHDTGIFSFDYLYKLGKEFSEK